MVYRGRVESGVVVFEGEARLPDGVPVEVTPIETRTPSGGESAEDDPIYRIYELAVPCGIPDLSENIDHYLYGHPKASDEQP